MIQLHADIDAEPRARRWTREEYYQLYEMGMFEEQRVELIDGEIIVMSPQSNSHVVSIALVERTLRTAFGDGFWVRNQAPIRLVPASEPEPDLAVVAGEPLDFKDHPADALLVVEVSDRSLMHDSKRKAGLYAKAGIADYWIVNLRNRRLEVFRSPIVDPAAEFGYRYAEVTRLLPGETVSPLAKPNVRIAVADLLPREKVAR